VNELTVNFDRHRVPLSSAQRASRRGPYPYWGANGPIDSIDAYIFDGPYILIAEDGNTVVRANGRGTVHWADGQFWVNNHTHVLAAAPGVDLPWLYFALTHVEIRPYITGSAQPKLSQRNLNSVRLPTPPEKEQRRIAAVLGALDDKIDSNRRLAEALEKTAATVFRARFVDFVGVEEFEDSEMGRIPRRWRACRFSDAVDINPPVPLRKGVVAPFIEMSAVAPWAVRPQRIGERPYSGGARFQPGDTLMARITPCIEHGKGAFIDFLSTPGSGSTEFIVLRAKRPLTPEVVFFFSRDERVRSHAIANMTGSSGRQRVATGCFDDLKVPIPPDGDCWKEDGELLRAALSVSCGLWRESLLLIALRDTLLPKLISGQIRVPDTHDPEEVIGPVVEELAAATL
jgi:type I restriction enzyme S subunit